MVAVRSAVVFAITLASEGARVHKKVRKHSSTSGTCADPASAVVDTMNCVKNKDSSCANDGYSRSGFEKYHNSVKDTRQVFATDWTAAMKYSTSKTWVNFQESIGKNQAEVRYLEDVKMSDGSDFGLSPSNTYPFNATFRQYEHAIVTVDADCRIIRWDQYGDNKQQRDADDAMDALIALVGIDGSLVQEASSVEEASSSVLAEKSSIGAERSGGCSDPLTEIIRVMNCIRDKDSACATAGYNWVKFNKYHNGVNAGVQLWPVDIYWSMATKFSTLTLNYDYTRNIDNRLKGNRASVRYVEEVVMSDGTDFGLEPSNTYPFNVTVYQHEHALVTVDDNCKITRWDQYGDDEEQVAVDTLMDAFFENQGVRCDVGLALPWQC